MLKHQHQELVTVEEENLKLKRLKARAQKGLDIDDAPQDKVSSIKFNVLKEADAK
jgi:hypothetical protein